jgi:glycosyltransferase involved in cell wall biosynthesis
MRILMLHPHDIRYHPWTIRTIKLAEELSKRGHELQVAFVEHKRAAEPDFPRIREIPQGDVRYLPLRSRDKHTHQNIFDVIRLARDCDIIHFQKCFPSTFIPALWAAFRHKKSLHYDWDDNETLILEEINGLPRGFYHQARFFEKQIPACVDTISVASDGLWEICAQMGFPESRMRKVPVGADLDAFDPNRSGEIFRHSSPYQLRDQPLVVYIGQLEGAAYASLFVKACGQLANRFPEATFMICGGGPMLAELEGLAYELHLSHRIVFTDYLPSDKIPEVLAAADVAVACFADEQFVRCKSPLKVAEYLAAGKAIVASKVGEIPWMTGEAAILVKPGDINDLAQGIELLLVNPELRHTLEKKARARAESVVNWRQSALQLEEAYQIARQ